MAEADLKHMHQDMEDMKRDLALIKDVLLEEGELTEEAKQKLAKARKTPISGYISHEEVKKKFLR